MYSTESPMLAEIRLVYRLARELARRRTAAAVIVIAGDDNLTDTYGLSTGDSTEKILFHALRNLPSRNYVEFTTGGHFAEAARHLALGMAELWPQFPILTLHGQIGIPPADRVDRKSTRLNSSHSSISYAVFCL